MRFVFLLLTMAMAMLVGAEEVGFLPSQTCQLCHRLVPGTGGQGTRLGEAMAQVPGWKTSVMAFASKDPYWMAKAMAEKRAHPEAPFSVDSVCLRCHAPMQVIADERAGKPVALEGLNALGSDGVSCMVCHQISPENLGKKASFTGRPGYATGLVAFGPHAEPFTMPMLHHTGVTAKEGRQILEASLCGSCHTVLTPTLNERGDIVGEFLEQGPYLEWLASSFAGKKSCQNCHVPQAEGGAGAESHFYIAHNPMGRAFPPTSPRTPFGVHSFAGGNAALLDLLAKQEGAGEGIAVSAGRTRQNLRRAAFLKMEASREADGVALRVTIRNLTGHKLPTGFPSRRMWLRVSAFDGTGRVLFESGGLDGSGQEIASRDARVNAGLQPHLNVINRPEQVAIYEAEMADESGERTHSLLRASRFHKDNRLLPAGFAPTPERLPEGVRPEWIAPAGTEGDGDFVAGADSVTYRLPGAATRVKADLLFQSIKPSQIRAIRGRGGAVPDALLDGLQGALSVETLAEAELVIGSSGEARR